MHKEKRELEEIEIDIDQPEPLSKKQKRLVKKGKLDVTKSGSTESGSKEASKESKDSKDSGEFDEPKEHKILSGGDKKSKFGVWIGNLSFDTTRDELIRFFNSRNIDNRDIVRIYLPSSKKSKNLNMGFAYVDFSDKETLEQCLGLSESNLNGRNLLIKNEQSQEGRPPPKDSQNHAASRILFIGNLSFDTKDEDLQQLFQHCGTITKIRMATFEDTGSCKGFAFIDFLDVESAVKAISDKRCKRLHGRSLRMEYGEDRSRRKPGQQMREQQAAQEAEVVKHSSEPKAAVVAEKSNIKTKSDKTKKKTFTPRPRSTGPTSGMALAHAQRAKQSIVPSQGKKVTFD